MEIGMMDSHPFFLLKCNNKIEINTSKKLFYIV